MKPSIKRIVILLVVISGIILTGLVPNVNKANAIRYTRVYENTDTKRETIAVSQSQLTDTVKTKKEKARPAEHKKKAYKKESIQADAKLKDIKPAMFSRAMHYQEEIVLLPDSIDRGEPDDSVVTVVLGSVENHQ